MVAAVILCCLVYVSHMGCILHWLHLLVCVRREERGDKCHARSRLEEVLTNKKVPTKRNKKAFLFFFSPSWGVSSVCLENPPHINTAVQHGPLSTHEERSERTPPTRSRVTFLANLSRYYDTSILSCNTSLVRSGFSHRLPSLP